MSKTSIGTWLGLLLLGGLYWTSLHRGPAWTVDQHESFALANEARIKALEAGPHMRTVDQWHTIAGFQSSIESARPQGTTLGAWLHEHDEAVSAKIDSNPARYTPRNE